VDLASDDIESSISESHTAMLSVLRGDTSAIGRMTQALRPYLKTVIRNELGGMNVGVEDESDIVQQALAQATAGLSGFRGQTISEWSAWLAAIARNEARRSRRYWQADRRSVRQQVTGVTELLENEAAELTSPSTAVSRDEEIARLAQALSKLPEAQRQLIQWRQNENLSHAEIANKLGITVETSRQRCKSAMDALRRAWTALESPPNHDD